MKKRLSREKDDRGRVITIPNLLSLLRLCLIPVIVWLYLVRGNQFAAGCLMVLSGLADVMDGRIARRFHMVSDLGKALDPIADKATQAAVLICLIAKFPLMVLPLIFLLGKELCMAVIGILLIRKTGEVPQACWHGKVVTAVLYTVMICHVFWWKIPQGLSVVLIVICLLLIGTSGILYLCQYVPLLCQKNHSSGSGPVSARSENIERGDDNACADFQLPHRERT